MKATQKPELIEEKSAGEVTTLSFGEDFQISGLEDVIYAMDIKTLNREHLLRIAMIGRYMTTHAEDLLFERDGGLNL